MLERIKGVLKLDVATFEEIEADESATSQAAIVVLIVAIIGAIGSGIASSYTGVSAGNGMLATVVTTFTGWVLWSAVTFFVGTKIFGGKADLGQMLRVIGFAYAPQMLAIIPCLGAVVGFFWSLAAGFVAVRQGLDLDNTKTFLTILIGVICLIIVQFFIASIFGISGAGLDALDNFR